MELVKNIKANSAEGPSAYKVNNVLGQFYRKELKTW